MRDVALVCMEARLSSEASERLRALSDDELDRLHEFSVRNQIGPIVAAAVIRSLEDPSRPRLRTWRETYDHSQCRMDAFLTELDVVAERLAREGIRLVALKNAGIARGVFPDRAACPMGDLDVLIERGRFLEAHRLILELGFQHASRSAVEPADLAHGIGSGGTEYLKRVGEHEVWFELQWRPVAGRWIPQDREPDGSVLIDRSVSIPGTDVRLLCAEDNMLQVALHTAKHSYVRAPGLRLHTDVDRLAAYQSPDWEKVVNLATSLGVKTATFFSLAIARALLRAAVPDGVLDRLSPPTWKVAAVTRWIRAVDVFEPEQRKFHRPGLLAFQALLYDDVGSIATSLRGGRGRRGIQGVVRRVTDLLTRYQ